METDRNWRQRASMAGIRTARPGEPTPRPCMVCFDITADDVVELPCGHRWCSSCLVRAFSNIHYQSQWPVRCSSECHVPISAVTKYLNSDKLQRLQTLVDEFEIPPSERLYCANPRCSKLLSRKEAHDHSVRCKECLTGTCVDCKATAHPGRSCPPPGQDEQQTLKLSNLNKWQRCSRCGQMCERDGGCPHMVCVCGYDFCYHCGSNIYDCNGCPGVEHNLDVLDDFRNVAINQRRREDQLPMRLQAQAAVAQILERGRQAQTHATNHQAQEPRNHQPRQHPHRGEIQEQHVNQIAAAPPIHARQQDMRTLADDVLDRLQPEREELERRYRFARMERERVQAAQEAAQVAQAAQRGQAIREARAAQAVRAEERQMDRFLAMLREYGLGEESTDQQTAQRARREAEQVETERGTVPILVGPASLRPIDPEQFSAQLQRPIPSGPVAPLPARGARGTRGFSFWRPRRSAQTANENEQRIS